MVSVMCKTDSNDVQESLNEPLARELAAGDLRALQAFQTAYRARIWAIAYRMTRDEWDAEEVVQDVLWTVYRKAGSFRGESELWHWVRRVTQNAARMLLRKRKRVPTPIEDDALEINLTADLDADRGTRTDAVATGRSTLDRLDGILSEQEPTNQRLFMMMDVEGYEKEEVAEALGLSVSAVKARLHRARKALREAFVDAPAGVVA